MNLLAKMIKRYIKTPLKYALPLFFIVSLALVATAGCIDNNNKQTTQTYTPSASGGGGGGGSNIAVAINSMQESSRLGNYPLSGTPRPSNKFIIFDVTVTNLHQNSWFIGSPLFFKLTTADSAVYQYSSSTYYLGSSALNAVSNTNPGEKVSGQIAFEIPQSAKATTLTYKDLGQNEVVTNLS